MTSRQVMEAQQRRWPLQQHPHLPTWPYSVIGQLTPFQPAPLPQATPEEQDQRFLTQLGQALRQITPGMILGGIATGFAFAIGSGLGAAFVDRYIFSPRRDGNGGR